MKRRLGDLRVREMQLQILLVLETMALEVAACRPVDDEPLLPKKKKKGENLNILLELYLDRLCIWFAVEGNSDGKKAESSDVVVREFCAEVIVPFYGARLPEKCKMITRKFGIPTGSNSKNSRTNRPRPRRQSQSQSQSQSQLQKPPRPTLQRVLTDEKVLSQQSRRSLTRSSTEQPLSGHERGESMEPSSLVSNTRGGIQKAKRTENREVDLSAAARQHQVKLRKMQTMVDQKKELDAAITALRRPNRQLVAKDMADAADQRLSTTRKPRNPVRNPLGHGVQVMATPKGARNREMMIGVPLPPKGISPVVPASSSGGRDASGGGSIQETPCRKPSTYRYCH